MRRETLNMLNAEQARHQMPPWHGTKSAQPLTCALNQTVGEVASSRLSIRAGFTAGSSTRSPRSDQARGAGCSQCASSALDTAFSAV